MAFTTAEEVIKYIADEGVEYVDVRFTDLPGIEQHFSIPAKAFNQDVFDDGLAFDGSSVRGFQSIHESDMLLLPDVTTARIDPFRAAKTLNVNFFVHDPFTRESYSRDPRNVARKAEEYLISTGIADTAFFGAEAEFYIFDSVSYDSKMNGAFYEVDAISGAWNTGNEYNADGTPNRGYKVRPKGGYFPVAPYDHYVDLRDEISTNLQNAGFELERGHHEVGTGGQAEINYKFNTLLSAADDLQLFKYIVKNTAWKAGKTATFMPKPLFGENGSGMHVHQSLFKDGENAFFDASDEYNLSSVARAYIAGLLKHAREICSVVAQWVNSYKRLVPGYEAPVYVSWARRNRSALVRVPTYKVGKAQAMRAEFRCPDPACNPYLAFAVQIAAGLKGIEKKYTLPDPIEKDIFEMDEKAREEAGITSLPGNLFEAIQEVSKSELVREALGNHIFEKFLENKKKEWDAFRTHVSKYEIDTYLPLL